MSTKSKEGMIDDLNESIIVRQSRLGKKSEQGKYEAHRSRTIFAGKKITNIIRK
jgi:hypothetical protein